MTMAPLSIHAATYRCQDSSGDRILTDNPAQLQDCVLFQADSSQPMPDNQSATAPGYEDPSGTSPDNLTATVNSPSHEASSPFEEITIPLTKMGGSLIVEVQLNQERTARLIVDTGASMTVLSTGVALDLGILGTTENELMTVNTAGGQVQVNVNYLSSLTVGSAQAYNVGVAIHDLPDIPSQIEGLLGMSFLKHFLVTLDAEHGKLILRPKQQS
ncbi:MAG: TIGR02281 family clan AA aspartic protease [Nitrospirales bacterium]